MDLSHLDKKYFIDAHIYNCPFCKRNNVSYKMVNHVSFDWSNQKECHCYIVRCESSGCSKSSLHLSYQDLRQLSHYNSQPMLQFRNELDIDTAMFYSQPTSFFVIDNRINEKIRELIYEAENSRKSNYLVGASACLRKAIYELLKYESAVIRNEKTGYANYEESIKSLKGKFPNVAPELFDTLSHIQELSSDFVHEGSWEAWDSSKLRFLIELTKSTLHEMYVIPEERKDRLGALNVLKSDFSKSKMKITNPEKGTTEMP